MNPLNGSVEAVPRHVEIPDRLSLKICDGLGISRPQAGMSNNREKVVVAMSGGVDSSVAACLLVEQGYEVIGLFMRVGDHSGIQHRDRAGAALNEGTPAPGPPPASARRAHQGCCSASDAADARFVAGMLDIPFYALNFEKDFDSLIDYFSNEYARGRTPNPCVMCNDRLKFGRLFEYADAVGARYVATGHYARTDRTDGPARMLRGVDPKKDQSYVLFGLRRNVLDRILFPIGDLHKDEVRRIAARYKLPNQNKPDSVEICFVPDRHYARVVRERRPDAFEEGEVIDIQGDVIGRHSGIANYTIGQRRGLKIAAGKPIYVTQLDVLNNRVVMGDSDDLLSAGLLADRVNLLADPRAANFSSRDHRNTTFRARVKIRYLHEAVPATVELLNGNRAKVDFDNPQRAVTPGQAVVFYDGDIVLGGAWIDSPIRSEGAVVPEVASFSTL